MLIHVNPRAAAAGTGVILSANTALFPILIPILRPSANSARVRARTPRDKPSGLGGLRLQRLLFFFCPSPLEPHGLPLRPLRFGRPPVACYCVLRLSPLDWLPRG